MPEFHASCPNCKKYSGKFAVKDEADDTEKKLRIKHWSVHEIEILHDLFTDEAHYVWRIPEDYKRQIRDGHLFHLERVDRNVLDAIAANQMFRFDPDAIFHLKEPTLSGVVNRGWGIPRLLSNFRQIWYVQVLHRQNEAIGLDYVIPFRVVTPAARQGAGGEGVDPLMMMSGGDFKAQARRMIRDRRRDPASIRIFPFPVNFQMFGADAKNLAPTELIQQGYERLLNDLDTPVEMFNATMQLEVAAPAMRLFESSHRPLVHGSCRLVAWIVARARRDYAIRIRRGPEAGDCGRQVLVSPAPVAVIKLLETN
jgi:hypothetical protein